MRMAGREWAECTKAFDSFESFESFELFGSFGRRPREGRRLFLYRIAKMSMIVVPL